MREGGEGSDLDVLAVDDTPANLKLLSRLLGGYGCRVRPVSSGRMALAAAAQRPPDVVLLDVSMPEMNGYEVCRELKKDPALQAIPVIFVSALSESFDKMEAFAAGGVDYVTKPFHVEEIFARIRTHVSLRRTQAELEARNEELSRANARLRELEQIRDLLTASIVHDLKSPLAVQIAGAQYLLGKPGLAPELAEVLGEILTSANTMHRMVLDLLDVSRRTEVALTPRRRSIAATELAEQACRIPRLQAAISGHRIEVRVDGARLVSLDADLLVRVIENLLDNAIKYAPSASEVELHLAAGDDGALSLRVADRGKGVPEAYREHVFDYNARLDRDLQKHARVSRGIGLAFCRLAVEAHGGRIWVEDNQPAGAVFCASIPGAGE